MEDEDLPLMGISRDGKISPELEFAITNRILNLKGNSEQFYAGKRNRWLDNFDHYINKRRKTRTTIPVPLASEFVDIVQADMISRAFATKPFCSVRGRTLEDQQSAPAVEALIGYQLFKMDIEHIAHQDTKQVLIYGSSPYRIIFDTDVIELPVPGTNGEIRLVEYTGPQVIVYDIFDYFPSPSKTEVNDAADSCVRMYKPWEYLEERADTFKGVYQNISAVPHKRIANLQSDDIDARQHRQSELGMMPEPTARGLIEILEADIWWPVETRNGQKIMKPCIFTLANGKLVRATRNNFISQDGNMGLSMIDQLPNDLFGFGLIDKMHPQLHGANIALDMLLTTLEHGVDPMSVYSKDQVKNEAQLRNRTGGVIGVRGDARTAVSRLSREDISPGAFQVMSLMIGGAENASGVKPVSRGESVHSTATVNIQAGQEAQSRFNLYMMKWENTFTKHICKRMHKINQQFLDLPSIVPIVQGQAIHWQKLSPQDIAIDADFEPQGVQKAVNTQMEISQIENFMAIAGGIPALIPIIPAVIGKLARAFRWPEADDIQKLAQSAVQQFQEMAQQQAAAAQGGGGPSSRQIGAYGNTAGIESTNDTDLNQAFNGKFGMSAYS